MDDFNKRFKSFFKKKIEPEMLLLAVTKVGSVVRNRKNKNLVKAFMTWKFFRLRSKENKINMGVHIPVNPMTGLHIEKANINLLHPSPTPSEKLFESPVTGQTHYSREINSFITTRSYSNSVSNVSREKSFTSPKIHEPSSSPLVDKPSPRSIPDKERTASSTRTMAALSLALPNREYKRKSIMIRNPSASVSTHGVQFNTKVDFLTPSPALSSAKSSASPNKFTQVNTPVTPFSQSYSATIYSPNPYIGEETRHKFAISLDPVQEDLNELKNSEDEENHRKYRVRYRWRVVIRKIIFFSRIAIKQSKQINSEKLNANLLPHRIMDYFLVYSAEFPDSILSRKPDSILPLADVELLLLDYGPNTAGLKPKLVDRYPAIDHSLTPIQDAWSMFAFPNGCHLTTVYEAPKHHFAVMTLGDGAQLFATFLTFLEPVHASLVGLPRVSLNTIAPVDRHLPLNSRLANRRACALFVPRVIALVSHYPLFDFMKENLHHWLSMETSFCEIAVEKYIVQLVAEIPLPVSGQCAVSYNASSQRHGNLTFTLPASRHPLCSSIPLNILFSTLSVDTIVGVIASILYESRIIFYSFSLSTMTSIIQSFLQLIYPFQWCSVYIPLLPADLLEAYECPQPYILGIDSKQLSLLSDLQDVILVDIDHNCIRSTNFLPRLPNLEGSVLFNELNALIEKRAASRDFAYPDPIATAHVKPTESISPIGPTYIPSPVNNGYSLFLSSVSQLHPNISSFDSHIYSIFLKFFASLVAGYRRFLFFIDGVPFFNASSFLESKENHISSRPRKTSEIPAATEFFDKFLESRLFSRFLEEYSTPYHDYLATESRQHLDLINSCDSAPVEIFTIPKPVCDVSGKADNKLSPSLSLPVSLSVCISQAISNSADLNMLGVLTTTNPSSSSMLLSPLGPQTKNITPWISHIYASSFVSSNNFRPLKSQIRAFSSNSKSKDKVDVFESSLALINLNNIAKSAADVASFSSLLCPFVFPLRKIYIESEPRDIRLPYSIAPLVIVRRVRHLENTSQYKTEHETVVRTFMSRVFSSQKFEHKELDDILKLLKEEPVRHCISTIIRSPFVHERESDSSQPVGPLPISFSLSSSSAAPSLCLSALSFDALESILVNMLKVCSEQEDFRDAVCAMDASTVFYRDATKQSKVVSSISARDYIEIKIKNNVFWKNLKFWKFILDAEIATCNFPTHAAKSEYILQYFIKSVHKMLSLGVLPAHVSEFVEGEGISHSLDTSQKSTLKVFVENMSQAITMEFM